MVLQIQFWSVKCMFITRLRKNFEQLFSPIQAMQGDKLQFVHINNSLQKVFKHVYNVHPYSNCTINQLDYYIADK